MAAKTKLQISALDTHKRVRKILSEQLGVREEAIVLESTMIDHGGDSLDEVEIVMAFEEEWETEISDDEMEKVRTMRDVIALILPKINARCSFDAAHKAAAELNDLKGSNKPSPKKAPAHWDQTPVKRTIVSAPAEEKPVGLIHADELAEYTISQTVAEEFTKRFNHLFSNREAAHAARYNLPNSSDTWRIQLTSRLNYDGHDAIVGLLEDAGFMMDKVTEHMVQLDGTEIRFGFVSAVHFKLGNLD